MDSSLVSLKLFDHCLINVPNGMSSIVTCPEIKQYMACLAETWSDYVISLEMKGEKDEQK